MSIAADQAGSEHTSGTPVRLTGDGTATANAGALTREPVGETSRRRQSRFKTTVQRRWEERGEAWGITSRIPPPPPRVPSLCIASCFTTVLINEPHPGPDYRLLPKAANRGPAPPPRLPRTPPPDASPGRLPRTPSSEDGLRRAEQTERNKRPFLASGLSYIFEVKLTDRISVALEGFCSVPGD
ncbi:hypothetical protein SKAU_G00336700 [Synaphobranchus kaupii]|uniref:Uncharacterized protein n=1 Tax=Synaphobranchus kaupii TaxID=118154 RepID=A0A9Q1EM97_SYNKA|nr:hypothetical protein SKAU_G00336700 [Synaphobranchus kaupii]